MDLLPTRMADTSMSTIAAPSLDMEVFEDAVESQEDEMDFEQVEGHSTNHAGVIPAAPPHSPTQFQISLPNADPIPMRDTSSSTGQVTINTTLLNGRQPSIRAREESEPITKRMAVEVDNSVRLREKVYQLRGQISELTDTSKRRLQREKDRARAAVEDVEKRALERDNQWKMHLAESLSKMKVEMEGRIEDRDREWKVRLESKLREPAEKDCTNAELKRLEEKVAAMKVEHERTIARMMATTQRAQPPSGPLESSTGMLGPPKPSFTEPSAMTTPDTVPVASRPTDVFGQIASVRRAHKRTKINTRLVLNEVMWLAKEDQVSDTDIQYFRLNQARALPQSLKSPCLKQIWKAWTMING